MKKASDKKTVQEEIAALAAMPDDQIDTSDAPELSDEAWANAVRGKFYKPVKQQLTVRLDADVLDWLKKKTPGRGYQTYMNHLLREAMKLDYRLDRGK